jgi:hypothetical protein
MKALKFVLFLALTLYFFLTACDSFERKATLSFGNVQPDSTWPWINTGEAFSFRLPPGLEPKEMHGIDSNVGAYENSSLRIDFDYGWYSSYTRDHGQRNYTKEETEINGHRAIIVAYRLEGESPPAHEGFKYYTSAYFPFPVQDEEGSEIVADTTNELVMEALCKTTQDCALARGVFESIHFQE